MASVPIAPETFNPYLRRWDLRPDGEPFSSYTRSLLLPVRRLGPDGQDEAAILKLPGSPEERAGSRLMAWWEGDGAARVLAWEEETGVLLLERAQGDRSLMAMLDQGRDEEATRVLARAAAALHRPRPKPLPDTLVPLERWFRQLWPAAEGLGGVFRHSARVARELLDAPQGSVVLHGDLHHENLLDFGPERGWLAIDPKGLVGERGFELVHHLFDRDVAIPPPEDLVHRQLQVAAEEAGLDPARQRRWALAWGGLSAVWCIEDGISPTAVIAVAEMMAAAVAEDEASPPC